MEKQRLGIYIGETSRSLFERSMEHYRDMESFSHKSHIVKHWVLQHPELETAPSFKFKILEQYKDCLSRQVGEAIKILYSPDVLLNSKSEYLNNCLTRITISEQDWERRERERHEDEEEKAEQSRIEIFRQEKLRARQSSHNEEEYTGSVQGNSDLPQDEVIQLDSGHDGQGPVGGHQVQQLQCPGQQQNNDMSDLVPLAGWWRRMESTSEGPAKRKQRMLDRKQMLKRDPLHLAWWTIWWLRMERMAITEERARNDEKCRQVASKSLKKFLSYSCMTPENGNSKYLSTAKPESASTSKRQPLRETHAGSPAKKIRLQNFTTALQFWVRGTENDANISTQPDNVIQVRNQRIIDPISVKLKDGTNLEISPGDNDVIVA
jgi:hypothetical protein